MKKTFEKNMSLSEIRLYIIRALVISLYVFNELILAIALKKVATPKEQILIIDGKIFVANENTKLIYVFREMKIKAIPKHKQSKPHFEINNDIWLVLNSCKIIQFCKKKNPFNNNLQFLLFRTLVRIFNSKKWSRMRSFQFLGTLLENLEFRGILSPCKCLISKTNKCFQVRLR